MNKSKLVAKVAAKTGQTQAEVLKTVECIFGGPSTTGVIAERLYQEDDVKIAGFGDFKATKRAERNGRNPQTGEALVIAAKNACSFKPSKALKEYIQD